MDPDTRSRPILDVCGTGGDRLNTFNISTTVVALVCAAAGVTVAKHWQPRRHFASRECGDVLEALGVRIEQSPEEAARSLREHHFAFFFAPRYHLVVFGLTRPGQNLRGQRGRGAPFSITSASC